MAKAKGAKKKAAKPKPKAKAKAKKPAPAKKVVVAKPAADSGLAKRVNALEAAISSLKKPSSGTGNTSASAIAKAIDEASAEIRQRAEDADHIAMAEVRKHVDRAVAELAAADERLHSEIGAVAAQGDLKMDEINVLRRRIDELEARIEAKK